MGNEENKRKAGKAGRIRSLRELVRVGYLGELVGSGGIAGLHQLGSIARWGMVPILRQSGETGNIESIGQPYR